MLDLEKMQDVLLRNWTSFIDKNRLLAFTLVCLRDHGDDFTKVNGDPPTGGNKVNLSLISPVENGFEIWIDFQWGLANGVVVGTVEVDIDNKGSVVAHRTAGVIY